MKKIALIITIVISIITIQMSSAQNTQKEQKQNPYTLVYDGAITENIIKQQTLVV